MAQYLILKKRRDFLKAAKDISFITHHVVVQAVFCAEKDKSGLPRIGFTATKKIGKAFYRNRTKRRLRAVVRDLGKKRLKNNVDYVFVARRDTGTCPFEELKDNIAFALQHVNTMLVKQQKEQEKNAKIAKTADNTD